MTWLCQEQYCISYSRVLTLGLSQSYLFPIFMRPGVRVAIRTVPSIFLSIILWLGDGTWHMARILAKGKWKATGILLAREKKGGGGVDYGWYTVER